MGKSTFSKTKGRLAATVNESVLAQLKEIHVLECSFAEEADRCIPAWSHVVEMVLRKGIKAYKSSLK